MPISALFATRNPRSGDRVDSSFQIPAVPNPKPAENPQFRLVPNRFGKTEHGSFLRDPIWTFA